MNVSAIVKHHQAVTAIIAQAMSDYASSATGSSWNNACFAFEADAIFSALSRAGYHIIGPGEQAVTEAMVEAAAVSLRPDLFTPIDPADLRSDDYAWTHREDAKAKVLHKASEALKAAMEARE